MRDCIDTLLDTERVLARDIIFDWNLRRFPNRDAIGARRTRERLTTWIIAIRLVRDAIRKECGE